MAEEDDSRRGSWYQQVTGLVTPQEKTPTETFFACQCLSIKQRFIAISICGGGGLLVLVLCGLVGGLIFDPSTALVTGGPQPFELIVFVFLYLSGLAMLVVSTCFWESPMKQCKNMLMGGKIFATIIFFLICAALVAIVLVPATSQVEAVFKVPAMCFLMVVQAIVFIWYLLATIPIARTMLCQAIKSVFRQ